MGKKLSNRGFDADSDSGRNYASGSWGGGDLDAAALASKYNLDTSQKGRGDGHIWGRNADGSEVYIGKSSMDLASNKQLISNHSKQANSGEVNHSGVPESLSSSGDIKGAILTEWNGGPAAQEAPEPESDRELDRPESKQIKQAKERVKNYESDILSGETSRRIYGQNQGFLDKYQFNPSAPAGAYDSKPIEAQYQEDTFSGSDISPFDTTEANVQAAASFLKDQKNKTIKQANIQPVN